MKPVFRKRGDGMKKAVALLLAAVFTVCLFSSCRKNEITALYFAVNGAAESFDPQIVGPGAASVVVRNCFEGLVSVNENGEILPGAATRWEISEDGLTYRFYLRSGAKWHVSSTARSGLGEKLPEDFAPEVTADDFVFALRRAVDPLTGARSAELLSNISGAPEILAGEVPRESLGVRAADEHTLEITLLQPEPGFLETLTEPVCMPCNRTFFEASGGRYGLLMRYILSNGPFFLTRFDDTSFRMERDPLYTGPHPAQADVIWLYSGDDTAAVINGLAERDYSGAYLTETEASGLRLHKAETLRAGDVLRGFLFNCKNEALANDDIRRAFFAAADVQALCAAAGKTATGAYSPAALRPSLADVSSPAPQKAARYLERGLAALPETDLNFTLLCEEAYNTPLRYFLQEWQKAFGVNCSVTLENVSAAALEKRVAEGDYDIAFYPVRASLFSAAGYYSRFSAGNAGGSLCSLESAVYDAAVQALRFAAPGAVDSALRRAEKLLSSEYVLLPVWQESTCFVCVQGVSGVILLGGADRLYLYNAVC